MNERQRAFREALGDELGKLESAICKAANQSYVLSVFAEAILQPNGRGPTTQYQLEKVEAEALTSAIFDAEHRCRELKEKFAAAFEQAHAAADGVR